MPEPAAKPPVLFVLAAEGLLPVLAGCAGAVAGGPVGGVAGVAIGHAVEKAINLFGRGIVERWRAWFADHPGDAAAAVAGLAAVPPAEARAAAKSILLDLAPDAGAADLSLAVEFLTAIPPAVDRALVPDAAGGRSLNPTVLWDDPRSLLQLLPEDVPPYPAETPLAGTPYRLRELLGAGGFGAVYRAESPSLQHLPLAIKFCLDRSLLPALNQERSNLERLMRAGGRGSAHVVRLYGYDLDHATPYLVYEFVAGGDLTRLLSARCAALGRPPGPTEVFDWVVQITEGLAFAHAAGLVHRDLKPANVLVAGDALKLADFGIGGVAAAARAVRSRIGASTIDFLSLADQASLFRGAGTPLYMSPEQRRGAAPDPRHDLYALGVMWFQLLVGDVSRELPHGWAKELTVRYGVPAEHVALVERCVGWMDERPKDAGELLPLLKASPGREPGGSIASEPPRTPGLTPAPAPAAPTVTGAGQATPSPLTDGRRHGLSAALARLNHAYDEWNDMAKWTFANTAAWGALIAVPAGLFFAFVSETARRDSAFVGVPIAAAVWGLYVYLMRAGVKGVADDLQKKAEAIVEEIAADFDTEVAAWGGRAALRHPPTVRRLKAELDPPALSPAGAATTPVVGDRRRGLVVALARLGDVHSKQERVRTRGFGVAIARGLALGYLPGWFVGELAYAGLRGGGYFFAWSRPRPFDPSATVLGILAGLAVAAGYVFLVWSRSRVAAAALAEKADRLVDEIAADFGPELVAWGGRAALREPRTVRRLRAELDPPAPPPVSATSGLGPDDVLADPTRKALLLARLEQLRNVRKGVSEARDATWIGLVFGWLAGIPAAAGATYGMWDRYGDGKGEVGMMLTIANGLAAAVLIWYAMAAIRRAQARRWDTAADRFAADYPQLVENWGGRGALESPEAMAAVTKLLDPTFGTGSAGFFRRMFGG